MSGHSEAYFKVRSQILESVDSTGTVSLIESLPKQKDLRVEEAISLALIGYSHVLRATDDENYQKKLLFEHVLPLCLSENPDPGPEVQYAFAKLREFLRNYIESTAEVRQNTLRHQIVSHCLAYWDSSRRAIPVCAVLRTVGFRTPEVSERLLTILNDDYLRAHAADSLASLGVTDNIRPVLTNAARQLTQSKEPQDALYPLQELRSLEALQILFECIEREQSSIRMFHYYCIVAAVKVGREFRNDEILQNHIWNLVTSRLDIQKHPVPFEGCDSRLVPLTLAKWSTHIENPSLQKRVFYSLSSRLEDLYLPRQLEGFSDVLQDEETRHVLIAFATQDSKIDGRSRTIEAKEKELAWKWLMNCGFGDATQTALAAYRSEANVYVRAETLEMLAIRKLDHLPEEVKFLIEEPHDCGPGDGTLFTRVAASKVAASCCSRVAWESLLNFGFTVDSGNVLRSSVEVLFSVAQRLLSQGDESIISDLFKATDVAAPPNKREAAACVLGRLVWNCTLTPQQTSQYLHLLKDESFNDYVKDRLLEGVREFGDIAKHELVLWATERLAKRRSSAVITVFLVGNDATQRIDDHIRTYLALSERENLETLDADLWQDGWLLANLYSRHPNRFEGTVCRVLEGGKSDSCFQLCQTLWHLGIRSRTFGDAIIKRLIAKPSWIEYESFLFQSLAYIAPDVFLQDWWVSRYDEWSKETRVAFVKSHSMLELDRTVSQPQTSRLIHGTGDTVQTVRRAALQELSYADANLLCGLVRAWASSKSFLIRALAAEALEFLPLSKFPLSSIAEELKLDPVRIVRVSATYSVEEGLRRGLSESYLSKIFELIETQRDPTIEGFKYGDALSNIGNEADVHKIEDYIEEHRERLLPNVSFWLERINETVRKRLEKPSKDGGHNWLATNLIRERFDATLVGKEISINVSLDLWRRPQTAPDSLGEWYGTAYCTEQSFLPIIENVMKVEAIGREQAEVIVSSATNGRIVVHGSGQYPKTVRTS